MGFHFNFFNLSTSIMIVYFYLNLFSGFMIALPFLSYYPFNIFIFLGKPPHLVFSFFYRD